MNEETQTTEHNPTKRRLNKRTKITIGIVIAVIIALAGGMVAWLYTGEPVGVKKTIFSSVPLPVAFVQTQMVPSTEWFRRVTLANKIATDSQIPTDGLESQILKQLIDSRKLEIIAANNNVKATKEEIELEFTNALEQSGKASAEELEADLQSRFNMDINTLKNDVLYQTVLQNNLMVWFNSQEQLNNTAYTTARELTAKLDSGTSFDEVAKQYTQDEASRNFAGDSGFVPYDKMLPEFQKAVSSMGINDSKIVASRFGVHILKVLAIQEGENGAGKSYHLQQIFIKPANFGEWLQKQFDAIRSTTLL